MDSSSATHKNRHVYNNVPQVKEYNSYILEQITAIHVMTF